MFFLSHTRQSHVKETKHMSLDTKVADGVLPLGARWLPRRPPGAFHCVTCNVDFTRKCDLLRHINSSVNHQKLREAGVIHGCPQCGKAFLTEKAVKIHFDNQHSVLN
jgi:uncharacterized C2H2 Zn-finger protein